MLECKARINPGIMDDHCIPKGDFYETENTKISACHSCTGVIPVPYYWLLTFPNSAPKADKNTSQETIAEEATENSSDDSASQPDEAALAAAREAFDQYTENLFKQEASQSLLTLHYTLADPESYGITDYDRTLGVPERDTQGRTLHYSTPELEKNTLATAKAAGKSWTSQTKQLFWRPKKPRQLQNLFKQNSFLLFTIHWLKERTFA